MFTTQIVQTQKETRVQNGVFWRPQKKPSRFGAKLCWGPLFWVAEPTKMANRGELPQWFHFPEKVTKGTLQNLKLENCRLPAIVSACRFVLGKWVHSMEHGMPMALVQLCKRWPHPQCQTYGCFEPIAVTVCWTLKPLEGPWRFGTSPSVWGQTSKQDVVRRRNRKPKSCLTKYVISPDIVWSTSSASSDAILHRHPPIDHYISSYLTKDTTINSNEKQTNTAKGQTDLIWAREWFRVQAPPISQCL